MEEKGWDGMIGKGSPMRPGSVIGYISKERHQNLRGPWMA